MKTFSRGLTALALVLLVGLSGCGESRTEEQRMTDAVAAFNAGEYRAALIELKNLLQENPRSKDARVLLAHTSLKVGDPEAAAKELERAERLGASPGEIYALQQSTWLKLGSNQELVDNYSVDKSSSKEEQAEMLLLYAKALSGLERLAEAREEYQVLVNSDAAANWRAEALVGLALISRAENDDDKARELANQALSIYSDTAAAHTMLGQIAIARSEFDQAYGHFAAGLESTVITDDERFIMLSGELEAALGKADIEASKDAANRLFTHAPEHPITSYLLARVAYVSGDKEMAHEQTQTVLSKFPEFMPAQFLQGALSLERGEYPQAEMFLSNVVAAQPTNFEARRLLAEANLRLEQPQEAANILRQGIRLGPGRQELSRMLGRVNLRFDNTGDNILVLEKTLEANPGDEQTRLALVASYIAAGEAEKAKAIVESSDDEALTPERKAIVKLIAAMQAEDRTTAVSQADNIIATWPDNVRAINMIGMWFYSQDMKGKARSTLENAFARHPGSGELASSLSRIDVADGNIDAAAARLEEFVSRDSQNVDVWLGLAAIAVTSGDNQKALEVLERARAAMPDEHLPKVGIVRLLTSERRMEEALALSEQTANEHETQSVAQYIHGRVLFDTGQYDLALQFLNRANSLQAGELEPLVYKARTEARLNRYAQAKKTYEQLWERMPGNLEAGQSIALLEQRKGNSGAANQILAELRSLRPDDARVDVVEADLQTERGNHKAAFDLYEKAYAAAPSRDVALKLARSAPHQGASGEQYIRRWLEQNPDDVAARLVLAQKFQQQGLSADAIAEYETIIVTNPDDGLVLNNLAWLHFESGQQEARERALELSRRAYELNPNSASIADTHGWILFRSGQVKQAMEILALAEARAKDQGQSDARDITYHYAAALSESGDQAGARLRLKSILNDNKPFYSREDAQRLLDSLSR